MEENSGMFSPRKKLKTSHLSITNPLAFNAPNLANTTMTPTSAPFGAEAVHNDKEILYGITQFVDSSSSSFSGILKKRYTDFLVNEILPTGEVVRLKNLRPEKRKGTDGVAHEDRQVENGRMVGEVKDEDAPEIATTAELTKVPELDHPMEDNAVQPTHSNAVSDMKPDHTDDQAPGLLTGIDASQDPLAHHFQNASPHLRRQLVKSFQPDKDALLIPDTPKSPHETYRVHMQFVDGAWKELNTEEEANLKDKQEQESAERIVIGADQTIVKEGNFYSPEKRRPVQSDGVASWNAFAGAEDGERLVLSTQDQSTLDNYFSIDIVDALKSLYNRIMQSPGRQPKTYGKVQSPQIDRKSRKQIHQDIRRIFNGKLDSQTDNDGHIIIAATPRQPTFPGRDHHNQQQTKGDRRGNEKRSGPRGAQMWAELGGEYLHFTLYKENKDTMESISWLNRQLRNKPRDFDFAGTKDRRAVTVQRVCVYRIFQDKLLLAGRTLRSATIGDFKYQPHKLQLGDLAGNEFVITIRDCRFGDTHSHTDKPALEVAAETVSTSVRSFNEHGFVNYYGLQRFGTFGFGTDAVGIALLQSNYLAAVNGILSFKPACLQPDAEDLSVAEAVSKDDRDRAQGINIWINTGDVDRALDRIPRRFAAETTILRHLSQNQNDYLGALKMIQRNHRLMFVHAYQSLVWNHAASARWKIFGEKVVEGDLVLAEKHHEAEREEVDADGEVVIQAVGDDRAADLEDKYTRARPLTREDAQSDKYTIYDVVLPTPGFDVEYPRNSIGDFYKTFMGSERGGYLDPHDMRRPYKDFSLSGSYRKLTARPSKDVTFEIKAYTDEHEQFVETDLDIYYKAHPKEDKRQKPRPPEHTEADTKARQAKNTSGEQHASLPGVSLWKGGEVSVPLAPVLASGSIEGVPLNAEAPTINSTSVSQHTLKPPSAYITQQYVSTGSLESPSSPHPSDTSQDIGVSLNPPAPPFEPTLTNNDDSDSFAEPFHTNTNLLPADGTDYPAATTSFKSASSTSEGGVLVADHPRLSKEKDEKIAVIIKMQLGSSTYATIALRELMKGGVTTWKGDFAGGR